MKKILLRVLISLVAVTVVCVIAFSACKDNSGDNDPFGTKNESSSTSAHPSSSQPVNDSTVPVSESTTAPSTSTTAPTTAPITTEPTTLSEQQIMLNNIAAMSNAVNQAKNTSDFYAHKDQKVSFKITDCSVSSIISAANKIISNFAHDNTKEYTFKNGISPNPKSGEPDVTPNEVIPPSNQAFSLDPAGLISLTAKTEGNNTVYTAIVKEETVTLDNQVPYYHAMAFDYLDINGTDIPTATIKAATIVYHDATVVVTVDNTTGKLVSYQEITPITSNGDVTVMFVPANGTVDGNLDETWTFKW